MIYNVSSGTLNLCLSISCLPLVGSGAVRIGPLHFLTGSSKSHTKSGCRLFCQLGQFFPFLFRVSGVCSVVFDCFWLSVPVQLIAWKDSSPNDLLCVEWDVKPYTLTHSISCLVLLEIKLGMEVQLWSTMPIYFHLNKFSAGVNL